MIERFVATDSQIESAAPDDPERHAGHGRRKKCAHGSDDNLPGQNLREAVEEDNRKRADTEQNDANRDRLAFVPKPIDKCADRRLRDDSRESASGNDDANIARIPVQRRGQIHREKRPESSMHISHEKIDRVERAQGSPARIDFLRGQDAGSVPTQSER